MTEIKKAEDLIGKDLSDYVFVESLEVLLKPIGGDTFYPFELLELKKEDSVLVLAKRFPGWFRYRKVLVLKKGTIGIAVQGGVVYEFADDKEKEISKKPLPNGHVSVSLSDV